VDIRGRKWRDAVEHWVM